MTQIVPVDPASPDARVIARAAAIIRSGGLVAFPTETVYGLGADALSGEAVAGIYAAKGRPAHNPVIVHVSDVAGARTLAATWPERAERLAARFWPGPLTIVVRRHAMVPDIVTAGQDSVAVRVPAHPIALALLRAADRPIAAPSANRSNAISPTTAAHVAASLGDRVPMILDGGATDVGIESTIIDVRGPQAVLLRPGVLDRETLAAVIGPISDPAPATAHDAPRPAPGMLERHYAPRAPVSLLTADEIGASLARDVHLRTAVLAFAPVSGAVHHAVRMPRSAGEYAQRLYAALHACDAAGASRILIERVPDGAAWEGVRDRLRRAATPESDGGATSRK